MNPKIEAALRSLPLALLIALGTYLWKIKNTLAAALVSRDEAIKEAEGLRASLAQANRAAVELQWEVDRARKERDAAEVRARDSALEAAALRRAYRCAIVAGLREGSPDDALVPFEKYEGSHGLAILKELGTWRTRAGKLAKACERAADYIISAADIIVDSPDGDDGDEDDEDDDADARRFAEELRALAAGEPESPRRAPVDQTRIDVVSAVIVRDGYLLLAKRLPTADFPELWECPGGKVEPGETLPAALAREIREELGVDVLSISQFKRVNSGPPVTKDYLAISFYLVDIGGQIPQPLASASLRWATREDVLSLPMLPGNSALRPELSALCAPACLSVDAVRAAGAEVARVEEDT